jgi:hypothetical protein
MTNHVITSQIAVSYRECHRKAFLLLFGDDDGTPQQYTSIIENQRSFNRDKQISALVEQGRKVRSFDNGSLVGKGDICTNARIAVNDN